MKSITWTERYTNDRLGRQLDLSAAKRGEDQQRRRAISLVHQARKRSELSPTPCQQCGAQKCQAHHDDYTKPLDVRWLCRRCHVAWHRANQPIFGKAPP